jgi:hypothetical protein
VSVLACCFRLDFSCLTDSAFVRLIVGLASVGELASAQASAEEFDAPDDLI